MVAIIKHALRNGLDKEFEKISLDLKRSAYHSPCQNFPHLYCRNKEIILSKLQRPLLTPIMKKDVLSTQIAPIVPDLMNICFKLELAGIGLGKEETTLLLLSLKNLAISEPIRSMRFWGKVYGMQKDYYIVEAELQEDAYLQEFKTELAMDSDSFAKKKGDLEMIEAKLDKNGELMEELPKSFWKPPIPIPPEPYGTGANKKVYYVCNILGEAWTRLPLVTPSQVRYFIDAMLISIARQIRILFTGNLEARLSTYPSFPGLEKNYLRAQISRITSTTVISPLNFYQFDEDTEEAAEEEASGRETFIENPQFEPLNCIELSDPGLNNWVHHTSYLLPQGRTTWLTVLFNSVSFEQIPF
ncbi:unnamed protein product [Protopolystoma xenopodis]|uniref:Uncharacterized protein n=1 Tax=Protopolystoma xenopodis TaxID=117903 RepID=A0A3S5A947_9PLAT|nr:unnamed protein product [Protopolystoma xenopodis]